MPLIQQIKHPVIHPLIRANDMSLYAIVYFIVTYLIGAISAAILLCKLFRLPDPRMNGSGNPGATNVFREGNKWIALLVLLFDILKGVLPVWIGYRLQFSHFELGMIALAACLGHCYPIYYGFKGGKGVATAFGSIAPIAWGVLGGMSGTWLLLFFISGYASLSSILTALVVPSFVYYFKPEFTFPVALVCCLLIYRHHENIQRLLKGEEKSIWSGLIGYIKK